MTSSVEAESRSGDDLSVLAGGEIDELTGAGDVDDPPARDSVGPEHVELGHRRTGVVAGTGQPEPATAPARVHGAGQRVFEKRKAPRIPFDCAGNLQWRAAPRKGFAAGFGTLSPLVPLRGRRKRCSWRSPSQGVWST